MLGMSRTVRQGRTVAFEFMQVREHAEAGLVFIAQPSGRPPTTFRLLKLGAAEAVFENLEIDFPQRVRYARLSDSHLAASIEGQPHGQPRRIDFAFTRAACDSTGPESRRDDRTPAGRGLDNLARPSGAPAFIFIWATGYLAAKAAAPHADASPSSSGAMPASWP